MKRRSKNRREKNQKAEEAPTKGKGKGAREPSRADHGNGGPRREGSAQDIMEVS